jgi:thiol-disulfide isomerase/thioredoxin
MALMPTLMPLAALAFLLASPRASAAEPPADRPAADPAEVRVVLYLRKHVRPGEPVVVSELYNRVFTAPPERAVLGRLFDSFFKLPLFIAQQQKTRGRPPSLAEIAGQFRFDVPGEADVMLRILESDPRVPRFLEREKKSGEITRVDVEAILADPRFGKALERSLGGWEGRKAPAWKASGAGGRPIGSDSLAGRPHLVYFWFSGCPPCVRSAPLLAELHKRYGGRGLEIVAVNADAVLELPVSAAEREDHARRNGWTFPLAEADAATTAAFGSVDIFPTLFFVDRRGVVVRQLVGFQELPALDAAARRSLE